MSIVYLHIGPHKTGTTYLQNMWRNNPEKLKKHNLVYPEIINKSSAHHNLALHLLSSKKSKKFDEDLSYINNINEDIIISSENFFFFKTKHFKQLKEIFKDKEIKIIYYFRNPTQRLVSLWQETIKQGACNSFFQYYVTHTLKPFKSQQLNPLLLLNILSEVFPKENIHIIDYGQAYSELSLMKEFEKVMHKKNVILDEKKLVNTMRSLVDIEILRVLNNKAVQNGLIIKNSNIRTTYDMLIDKNIIDMEVVKEKISAYNLSLELGDTRIDREIYVKLAREYGNNFVNNISKTKNKTYSLITDQYMQNEEIMTELEKIFSLVLQNIK